ncbi:MAG: hypothetical protein ACXVX8_16430 [Blastococcus sp.]
MAGSTITSHPAGARRSTTRRRPARRKPTNRRRPAVAGSRKKKARRRKGWSAERWWPALLVVAAVVAGVAWDSQSTGVPPVHGRCAIAGSPFTVTAEQVTNARTIAAVARDRGLPDRAIVIALATAQQESHLRNLDYGDRDSLGLFQQRPSQGWGTPAQVRDPVHAAGKFYDHLVKVPGWEKGDLTTVADTVQRSAFPLAYRQWTTFAEALTTAVRSTDRRAFVCA